MARAGNITKALLWGGVIAEVAALTVVLCLFATERAIDEAFGLDTWLPEGLAAPRAETSGEGHERSSAACEDRTRHKAAS